MSESHAAQIADAIAAGNGRLSDSAVPAIKSLIAVEVSDVNAQVPIT